MPLTFACAADLWGLWHPDMLHACASGATATAELLEDPLVKLDTTYMDLVLAMETMFPITEASGQDAAVGTSLLRIEEDAQLQSSPAIEPVTLPADLQPGQAVVDSHNPNV